MKHFSGRYQIYQNKLLKLLTKMIFIFHLTDTFYLTKEISFSKQHGVTADQK